MDGKIHEGKSPHYTTFSLWDTYRAVHPLYTVLYPDFNADMMRSLVEKGEQYGYLPKWELWGGETDCMIGFPCDLGSGRSHRERFGRIRL